MKAKISFLLAKKKREKKNTLEACRLNFLQSGKKWNTERISTFFCPIMNSCPLGLLQQSPVLPSPQVCRAGAVQMRCPTSAKMPSRHLRSDIIFHVFRASGRDASMWAWTKSVHSVHCGLGRCGGWGVSWQEAGRKNRLGKLWPHVAPISPLSHSHSCFT